MNNFCKDSNLWGVHVNVPWPVCYPRKSISNVVDSVTIHDDMFINIYVYMCIYTFEKMEKMKRKT